MSDPEPTREQKGRKESLNIFEMCLIKGFKEDWCEYTFKMLEAEKCRKKHLFFNGILKATDDKSRIGSVSPWYGYTDQDPYRTKISRIHCVKSKGFRFFFLESSKSFIRSRVHPDPDAHYQYGYGCTTLFPGGEVGQAGSQAGGQVGLRDETMAAGLQQGFHSLQLDQALLHQLK